MAAAAEVELAIYDILGQKIRVLERGYRAAGAHRVEWDGRDGNGYPVAGGIYFYHLRAGEFKQVRRLTLIK